MAHTRPRSIHITTLALIWCLPLGCAKTENGPEPVAKGDTMPPADKVLTDVASQAGITHRHRKPVLDHKLDNIQAWVASVGAAAAAGDFDNDGWLDLYATSSRKGEPNLLYRNNGDGTFTEMGKAAGVADANNDGGTSMDCVWGDYDNDGHIDLYVVRWGRDILYRNNGDGTFTDVTEKSFRARDGSPGTQWANGNAAVFLDFDLDGRLDIYVGNYFNEIDLWNLESTRIMHDDFENSRNAGPNFLYHQLPDGTFEEIGERMGLDDTGWTLAVGSADVNNDGWPDLYCADDFGPDQLFLNRRGTFENVSDMAIGFDTKKGMNVEFGDFNNDNWLDIYVTNITTAEYLQEGNMLWQNIGPAPEGDVSFVDVSLETGTYDGGWGWGAKFFDYDADGDLDIVSVNGFITAGEGNYWYDLASWTVTDSASVDAANWPAIGDRSFSGNERTRFWRNEDLYSFSERAVDVGLDSTGDGRGIVVFDYDNDGDLDVYIANQDQKPNLYRNGGVGDRHWLMVKLETDPEAKMNRDAIGARVTAVSSSRTQVRERDGGNGYAGQSDPRLYFGLGEDTTVSLLEIRWPDGGVQILENLPADRILTVRQDPSVYTKESVVIVRAPVPAAVDRTETRDTKPQLDPQTVEKFLGEAEQEMRQGWDGYALASLYRARCVEQEQYDRSIDFFESLAEQNPDDVRARIELACAYVEKIPTCGGIAALVCKGKLARKSLDILDEVIEENPDMWVAWYCRGMNHLHWPSALRHTDDAIADLKKCIELQNAASAGSPAISGVHADASSADGAAGLSVQADASPADGAPSFGVHAYVALGDAYIKHEEYEQGVETWQKGLELYPGSSDLEQRLALADDDARYEFVDSIRSLEKPSGTDLSFLDHGRRSTAPSALPTQ